MKHISDLSNNEIKRFSRQIILPEIRPAGQILLRNAKVLVVGLGGLGSPVLMYLASAGIETIGIIDYDELEIHNLQRQVIHAEENIGRKKTDSAAEFVNRINSDTKIIKHAAFLSEENAMAVIKEYDVVLDCTDNIFTRYIINDNCKILKKGFIAASVLKWEGQVFVFDRKGPCYRCLFPEKKNSVQNCDEAGVIGPVCGIIGCIQATETIKMLTNQSKPCFIVYDALNNKQKVFDIEKKFRCFVCVKNIFPDNLIMSSNVPKMPKLSSEYKTSWADYIKDKDNHTLVDIRSKVLYEICHLEGAINIPEADIMENTGLIANLKGIIVLLCKKGITASRLCNFLVEKGFHCKVVEGGLRKYKAEIDNSFPLE